MIYFLYGDNSYEIEQRLADIRQKYLESNSDNGLVNIDTTNMDIQEFSRELTANSLFSDNLLIIAQNITANTELWYGLENIIDQIPSSNTIVLTSENVLSKIPNLAITKTFKKLKTSGASIEKISLLKSYNLKKWLTTECRQRKLTINDSSISRLIELTTGDDNPQSRIAIELGKLSLLSNSIDINLINQTVEPSLTTNAFRVLDLALEGNKQVVITEIDNLIAAGEDPHRFLGLVFSQTTSLVVAITDSKLKINPYQLRSANQLIDQQIRKKGRANIQQAIHTLVERLAKLDHDVKLSSADLAWQKIKLCLLTV